MTRATLLALAEHVTTGQAADFAPFVPSRSALSLRPEHEQARPFDYTEFLRGIATSAKLPRPRRASR